MNWDLPALGAVFSMLIMFPLIIKWKLPKLPTLAGAFSISIIAALPFVWIYPNVELGWQVIIIILLQVAFAFFLGFALLMWRFWRDPERIPCEQEGVVLSAADGKVLYVKTVEQGITPLVKKSGRDYLLSEMTGTNLLSSSVYVIAIEMSFLDVHVNRCPIAGRVKMLKSIEGGFMSLGKEEAPFNNARLTTIIDNSAITLAVVQVASRLVRRVESYLVLGEPAQAGQRLGMIRFGSLVVVIMSQRDGVEIKVKSGDRVTAGISVLANYAFDNGLSG